MTDDATTTDQETEEAPPEETTSTKRSSKSAASRAVSALQKLLGRAPVDDEDAIFNKLVKLTGYKESDVTGFNADRRTIVTGNGGKYELSKTGRKFRTVSGPAAPSETEVPEEEE